MGKLKGYPECQETGIRWLGKIPGHWSVTRMSSVSRLRKEQVAADSLNDKTVLHYSIPNVQERGGAVLEDGSEIDSNKFCVLGGEILVSKLNPRKQTVSMTESTDSQAVCSTEFVCLQPKDGVDTKFLYYTFLSENIRQYLDSSVESVTRSHQRVNPEVIYKMLFASPPKVEQELLSAFLDHQTAKIDRLIAKQKRLIELLKEKRQAVISHAVTKGLNPDAPMKDSGVEWLGEVPKHWVVCKFSHHINFQEGPGIMADDFRDEGIPLLRIHNIKPGFIELEGCNFLDPEKVAKRWNHFRLDKGDLVISASATTGIVSEVSEKAIGAVPYTGLIRLKPGTSDIRQQYIKQLVVSGLFTTQIDLLIAGATIGHFGPTHLRQMIIALPPVEEQDEIVEQISREIVVIDKTIAKCSEAIELQNEHRTALISAAVTGKIDVRGWQKPDTESEETATAVSA